MSRNTRWSARAFRAGGRLWEQISIPADFLPSGSRWRAYDSEHMGTGGGCSQKGRARHGHRTRPKSIGGRIEFPSDDR
eukprot:1041859-Prorocentrum_minimum.AAC.3